MNPDDLRSALHVLADRVGDDRPDLIPGVRALAGRRRRARQVLAAAAVVVLLAVGVLGLRALDGGTKASLTPVAPPSTTSVPVPPAPGTSLPPRPARGQADNLNLPESVRTALGDAYYRRYLQPGGGGLSAISGYRRSDVSRPGGVHYGIVWGKTPADDIYYAVGEVHLPDPVSAQDGPHVWSMTATGEWRYLGDAGGAVPCQVPRALLISWSYPGVDKASYCHWQT